MAELGGAGVGLVWGWVVAPFVAGTPLNSGLAMVATTILVLESWLLAGRTAVWMVVGPAAIAAAVRLTVFPARRRGGGVNREEA